MTSSLKKTVETPPKTPPNEILRQVSQGEFDPPQHFYPRVLNAQIHPLIQSFFQLGHERIIARYCHLHPDVSPHHLASLLSFSPHHFQWAGSDLFHVTAENGHRQMIVVETNSCPSGQKSMPLLSLDEQGGYRQVIETAFRHRISTVDPRLGGLAVVYDKNPMEATGYAAVMADVTGEPVKLIEWYNQTLDPDLKWVDGLLYIRDESKEWKPIRACFRYVTQKPWNRFPLITKTVVLNPVISCLAGGRNKMMAAIAYEDLNQELKSTHLSIKTPETIKNVRKEEIPSWIHKMKGHAVLKNPYSNAGQGVYTITNPFELDAFMTKEHDYDKFIVQSLVGNASWSSETKAGKYFHIGTVPDKKNQTYVCDLRMMVSSGEHGFQPICIYGRRSRVPLTGKLAPDANTWDMLGTNLSIKLPDGGWTTDTSRLILMDQKDFSQLGLGIDDLIDAYIQTVLAVTAIDKMASRLMNHGEFDYKLFESLNPDNALMNELKQANDF